jgi:hypothetical protein
MVSPPSTPSLEVIFHHWQDTDDRDEQRRNADPNAHTNTSLLNA